MSRPLGGGEPDILVARSQYSYPFIGRPRRFAVRSSATLQPHIVSPTPSSHGQAVSQRPPIPSSGVQVHVGKSRPSPCGQTPSGVASDGHVSILSRSSINHMPLPADLT